MEIIIRDMHYQGNKEVTIKTDDIQISIGVFNKQEAVKLAYKFEIAVDELIDLNGNKVVE